MSILQGSSVFERQEELAQLIDGISLDGVWDTVLIPNVPLATARNLMLAVAALSIGGPLGDAIIAALNAVGISTGATNNDLLEQIENILNQLVNAKPQVQENNYFPE